MIEIIRPTNCYGHLFGSKYYNAYDNLSYSSASKANFSGTEIYGQAYGATADAWTSKKNVWSSARLVVSFQRDGSGDDATKIEITNSAGVVKHTLLPWCNGAVAMQDLSVALNQEDWGGPGFPDITDIRVSFSGAIVGGNDGATIYVYDIRVEGSFSVNARLEVIDLADIQLKNDGPLLRLSTRPVTVGGVMYEPYIESISGMQTDVKRRDSAFSNISAQIVIKNLPWRTYGRLIEVMDACPFAGAEIVIMEQRLEDGVVLEAPRTVLRGALDEPRDITLDHFSCNISSKLLLADKQWRQEVVDQNNWPFAYDEQGKREPEIFGSGLIVPALKVDWGRRTQLDTDITAAQTTGIRLVNPSGFPAAGTVIIDSEEITYTSIAADNALGGVTRGAGGTTAATHAIGSDIRQKPATFDNLIAAHEVRVDAVYADIGGQLLELASGFMTRVENGKTLVRANTSVQVKKDLREYMNIYAAPTYYSNFAGMHNLGVRVISVPAAPAGCVAAIKRIYSFFLNACTIWKLPDPGKEIEFKVDGATWWKMSSAGLTPVYMGAYNFIVDNVWFSGDVTFEITDPPNHNAQFYCIADVRQWWTAVATEAKDTARQVTMFAAKCSLLDTSATADFGGVAIERPDQVMKYLISNLPGHSLADIDLPSFAAAGAAYAEAINGGYKFGRALLSETAASDLLKSMALQCRSVLTTHDGLYRLTYLPDSSPGPLRTLSRSDLAGENAQFVFSQTELVDVENELSANWGQDYITNGWAGSARAEDGDSQARHGRYVATLDMDCIRDQAMADDVLQHILVERKRPLLKVEFSVFWDNFDLKPGDTIGIDNDLFGGREWWIESIRRQSPAIAEISAMEWWR